MTWNPVNDAQTPNWDAVCTCFYLLQENSYFLLQENGGKIILSGSALVPSWFTVNDAQTPNWQPVT